MPLKDHNVFVRAPTRSSALWRYTNLPKFLALLQSKALYFFNLELMARADPFEGTLPPSRFQHRQWSTIDDVPSHVKEKLPSFLVRGENDLRIAFDKFKGLAELRIRQAYAYRRSYFINCWHLSAFESSAMWDIYSRRNEGIAIVSSEERIDAALALCPDDVFGGQVHYEDYSSNDFVIEDDNMFRPVLCKRMSFSYESEYRLVYCDKSVTHKQIEVQDGFFEIEGEKVKVPDFLVSGIGLRGREEEEIEKMEPRPGHQIVCDTNKLIERVRISPLAEPWFAEVVVAACKTYGLLAPVTRSELVAAPLR
jgi:hypothetical protein